MENCHWKDIEVENELLVKFDNSTVRCYGTNGPFIGKLHVLSTNEIIVKTDDAKASNPLYIPEDGYIYPVIIFGKKFKYLQKLEVQIQTDTVTDPKIENIKRQLLIIEDMDGEIDLCKQRLITAVNRKKLALLELRKSSI